MEIKLTPEESEEYFYNAVCNLCGYLGGYGLELSYDEEDYKDAKKRILDKHKPGTTCYEDVMMEILRGGKPLKMIDHEGEGDMTREIFLKDVHERVQKTPLSHLQDMIDGNDDLITADVIIQTVFFQEIVFG